MPALCVARPRRTSPQHQIPDHEFCVTAPAREQLARPDGAGTPKSHQRRGVPIHRFLVDDLARHIADKGPDDPVSGGIRGLGPPCVSVFRKPFSAAATVIGIPGLHPHELRHIAASVAIASGADTKVVQQMLGHVSATMTLDTYGHLFENRLDRTHSPGEIPAVARRPLIPR